MSARYSNLSLLVFVAACAGSPEPTPKTPAKAAAPSTASHPDPQRTAPAKSDRIEKDPPAQIEAAKAAPPREFTLANIPPPHERSAQPGDGEWTRLGDPALGDRAGRGATVFLKTTLHPHPSSRFMSVTIAAIDLERTRIHYMPGADDVKAERIVGDREPGLIPNSQQSALLAVFNGGFKPAHGRWGMMLEGESFVPPRDEGCTVAIFKDDSVRVEPWPNLAKNADKLRAYRQTPPCLLIDGELHPKLQANNEKPWGGNVPNLVTRRRSAVGIDGSGRVLFYAYGEEVGAKLLAEGLRLVGAKGAAELDINWYWTRFLLFGQKQPDSELQITSTLVPKMEHLRTGYVVQKSDRDFFYILKRD